MLRKFRALFFLVPAMVALAQQPSPSPFPSPAKPKPPPIPEQKTTVSSVHVDGPYIALTFDDGPSEKLTPRLLDLLGQHHIHATFFVIGENVAQHPEILQRAAREGHEIGNHSWSHPNFARMSDDAVRSQIKRTKKRSPARLAHARFYFARPTVRLRRVKNTLFTMTWAMKLFCGTWILSTGRNLVQISLVVVF